MRSFLLALIPCIALATPPGNATPLRARDSLAITLHDAECRFLSCNYKLLAARFEIDQADAAVRQAAVWDNPTLSIAQGLYNKRTGRWFDATGSGQTAASIQQLFDLSGARGDRVDVQRAGAAIAREQFSDVMSGLRYQLRHAFAELYFTRRSSAVYDQELTALRALVDAYDAQQRLGNVSFKELARLQALQFSLQSEQLELQTTMREDEHVLGLLTACGTDTVLVPLLDEAHLDTINVTALSPDAVIDSAIAHRADVRSAALQIEMETANLSLQQALRIPSVAIGLNYDRNGSYIPDYNAISVSMEVPLWNVNSGNVEIARRKIDERVAQKRDALQTVRADVDRAVRQLIHADTLYRVARTLFDARYDALLTTVTAAYANHTISLLEFIDTYESYKSARLAFYHLQLNRVAAMEDLNRAAGMLFIP